MRFWQRTVCQRRSGSGGALGSQLTPLSPRLLAWQAWHLATSIFTLHGRRCTWRHGRAHIGFTVCADCSATLRMVPRPAVAIHLYSWCWYAGFGYITWSPTTYPPQDLYIQHFTHSTLHHTFTHTLLSHTTLSHAILWDTLAHAILVRATLLHPLLSHTALSPTALSHTNLPHTPLLHTTPLHTLLSPTTLLHGNLSRTSLRHTFLAHTDPPPSLFSFLPFPSHLHLSLAAYWKKLACGSFNVLLLISDLEQHSFLASIGR